MEQPLNTSLLQSLPPEILNHIQQPQINRVPFTLLTDQSITKAVNYIKTKTAIEMLSPPILQARNNKSSQQPIILVLCQPSQDIRQFLHNQAPPYANSSYIGWLQSAGAKCIPFPYNINEGSMQFLLQRAHGLVLPGGAANLYKSYQRKQGMGPITAGFGKIFRYIQKMWNKGIEFPIWGTCLGLQLILITLSNDIKILSNLNSRGHQTQIYSQYSNSNILKGMPLHLRFRLQNQKLLNFFHKHGISVKKFINSPKLVQKLKLVSISKDKDGKWFCSALEGKDRPIFLSQFHPQKQAFEWTKKGDIIRSKHSIQLSHYFASSFLKQAMRCKAQKAFANIAQLHFYNIHVFRQIMIEDRYYKVYAIDFKYRDYDKEQKRRISQVQGQATRIGASKKKIFI